VTVKKFYKDADLLLYQMVFNKDFRKDKNAKPELKIIRITPVCKECSEYI
jgi:hypothetical protein